MSDAKLATHREPKNQRQWLEQLRATVLPVMRASKQQALKKMRSASGNTHNVTALIATDPALALQVFTQASRALARSDTNVTSLEHAVGLLGFPAVEQLLDQLPEFDPNHPYSRHYQQAITTSRHAAEQLQAWSERQPHWQHPVLYWAALFHQAPIWAMWVAAGSKMEALERHRAHCGHRDRKIEEELLGSNLDALCAAQTQAWNLPSMSQQGWQPNHYGRPEQWIALSRLDQSSAAAALEQNSPLAQLAHQRSFAVTLANYFADLADWDWYSLKTLRCQKIIATCLRQPLDQTIRLHHRVAVECSRQHPNNHAMAPASQLLSGYSKAEAIAPERQLKPISLLEFDWQRNLLRRAVTIAPQEAQRIDAIHQQQQGEINYPQLRDTLQRLRHKSHTFSSLKQLLQLVTNTLNQAVGCERAILFIAKGPAMELHAQCHSGLGHAPKLRNFHHTPAENDLFGRLLQRPTSLFCQADNWPKIRAITPEAFLDASGSQQFFITSLFVNERPIGLLYADHSDPSATLQEEQYRHFKHLASAATAALTQLTQR